MILYGISVKEPRNIMDALVIISYFGDEYPDGVLRTEEDVLATYLPPPNTFLFMFRN
jgi:hypothetical protein